MSEEVADVWIGEVSGALLGTEVVTGCAEAVGTLPGCPRCRVLLRSMRDWGRDETGLPGSTDEDNNTPRSEADVALGLAAEGALGSEADVAPRSEAEGLGSEAEGALGSEAGAALKLEAGAALKLEAGAALRLEAGAAIRLEEAGTMAMGG